MLSKRISSNMLLHMRYRGRPAETEKGPVWTYRPSKLAQRVVDRVVASRPHVSRSQIMEYAVRLAFWQDTLTELEALHQQERKALEDIKIAMPPMEVQKAIADTLHSYFGQSPIDEEEEDDSLLEDPTPSKPLKRKAGP